jgi:hypothetical protein
MNSWQCLGLVALSGALGGLINSLLTDNGFAWPKLIENVWCPGFISNILIGSAAAVASWSFYGSGAGVDLAKAAAANSELSLTLSALSGAFLVGVGGSKWVRTPNASGNATDLARAGKLSLTQMQQAPPKLVASEGERWVLPQSRIFGRGSRWSIGTYY